MRLTRTAAAVLAFAAPHVAWANQDFTLINRTGYPIQSIYLTEVGDSDWGNDVMNRDKLYPGERVDIGFDRATQACRWNVLVKYEDDTSAVWTNLDLCSVRRLALFWDRATLETIARAE